MDKSSVTLCSINIEKSRHLERVLPFLEKEHPEICCVQELCQNDFHSFEQALGAEGIFVPMTNFDMDELQCVVGVGLFSRIPFKKKSVRYYFGDEKSLPKFVKGDEKSYNRVLVSCDVEKNGQVFRIGTTHFTWTPDGKADEAQRRDLVKLLRALDLEGEIVFTGDFNAPRGREIFSKIAEKYTDNVPTKYTSSIDGTFHRAGPLPYMVDGFFSSTAYEVSNVRMICGLSDHCALAGTIMRVPKG